MNSHKRLTQYLRDSWLSRDGSLNDGVQAIAQTPDGYLWVGTQDGLFRFDGINFKRYDRRLSRSLPSNDVLILICDHAGRLWIGTDKGLGCYDKGVFESINTNHGLSSNIIRALFEDSNSDLWIGTGGKGGLNVLRNGKIEKFTVADGLPDNTIYTIAQNSDGVLWVGTKAGLCRRANNEFIKVKLTDKNTTPIVNRLYLDRKGCMLAATDGDGLFLIEGDKVHQLENADLPNRLMSLFEDAHGNLWLGGYNTLHRWTNGKLETFKGKSWLRGLVNSLFEDREGSLWVGVIGGGLHRLSDGKVTAFTTQEGLISDAVWSVFEDTRERLWFGTADGLSCYKDGHFQNFNKEDGLAANTIYSIAEDHNGGLWFGTDGGGLSRLRDGEFTNFSKAHGLGSNTIFSIYADRTGDIWAGGKNGELSRITNDEIKVFANRSDLPRGAIWKIYKDSRGDLWLGTLGGLCRLAGDKIENLTAAGRFPSDVVYEIYEDRAGAMWFGTNAGGLVYFKNEGFIAITAADGLFDDLVYRIIEDDEGHFWMTCNRGIFSVEKKQLLDFVAGRIERISCFVLGREDGLPSAECSGGPSPAGWRTRSGKVWFPSSNGAISVDPQNISTNKLEPPVVIQKIVADERRISIDSPARLAAGTEKIEIHYAALSFVAASKMRYRYRLEGFDKGWVEAGNRRTAYYTNLPPGKYTFRVLAANSDGIWNTVGASFVFYLAPHIYQRKSFWAVCAAAAVGGSYAFYRSVMKERLRRVEERHQAILDERSRMSREIHDTLAQGLTGIISQLQAAELLTEEDERQKHFGLAKQLAKENLREARNWVAELRRAEPRKEIDSPPNLIRTIRQFIEQANERSAVKVVFRSHGKIYEIDQDVEVNLLRITQEAVNNALRHAAAAIIKVELEFKPDCIILTISDNGNGFDAAKNKGKGFGLLGMYERVELLGGQLEIKSRPDFGTVIMANIPTI
jgi:signal transduction histidine kinase/ligand-binding sensor domain-containing protein